MENLLYSRTEDSANTIYNFIKTERHLNEIYNFCKNKRNDVLCLVYIAHIYQTKCRYEEAIQLYNKAIRLYDRFISLRDRSKNIYGYTEACRHLAHMYYNGIGMTKNHRKAKKLYENACLVLSKYAFVDLGNLYYDKGEYGKAMKLYMIGCKYGCKYAYIKVGIIYLYGMGVKRSRELARTVFEIACDLGCEDGFYYLADMYNDERDTKKAIKLYKKGCELESVKCLEKMGDNYRCGFNVEKNIKKAEMYYRKACDLKHFDSFVMLYYLYYKKEDFVNASEILYRASFLSNFNKDEFDDYDDMMKLYMNNRIQ
jgi:TPR repeat protein